nr:MAG TPA: hypothetical protein [Caudoviricetes sp.]
MLPIINRLEFVFSLMYYRYNTINLHKSSIRTLYLSIVLRNLDNTI